MSGETAQATPARPPTGWVGKVGQWWLDGINLHACAEHGCLTDDWFKRVQQHGETRDARSPTIGKR